MDSFVFLGLVGGMLGNLVRLVSIAAMKPAERPLIFKDPYWYIQFVILAILGGFFVFLYESSVKMTGILAVNIGASAPIIAQNLASNAPKLGDGQGKVG